jgi:hypothetical protein
MCELAIASGSTTIEVHIPPHGKDYLNKDIYWGTAGTPSADASFASLTEAQKNLVAASLGYEVYTGSSYYKADAIIGQQMKAGFVVGNQVDYDLIDWGGVGAPALEFDGFESLGFAQREFVAEQLGYSLYNEQVYYNANADLPEGEQTIRIAFTEGADGDYAVADITAAEWGEVPKATAGTAWADLTFEQQDVILEKLGYSRFDGQVWNKGSDFTLTFVQGEVSKEADPENEGEFIYEFVEVEHPSFLLVHARSSPDEMITR